MTTAVQPAPSTPDSAASSRFLPLSDRKRRFKLLDGHHIGPDPSNPKRPDDWSTMTVEDQRKWIDTHTLYEKSYVAGDVVEIGDGETDLRHMNRLGFRPKFELLVEDGIAYLPEGVNVWDSNTETLDEFAARMRPQSIGPGTSNTLTPNNSALPNFDAMSVEQLRKYAEEEEIDCKSAKTKEQYAAVIKAFHKG